MKRCPRKIDLVHTSNTYCPKQSEATILSLGNVTTVHCPVLFWLAICGLVVQYSAVQPMQACFSTPFAGLMIHFTNTRVSFIHYLLPHAACLIHRCSRSCTSPLGLRLHRVSDVCAHHQHVYVGDKHTHRMLGWIQLQ